MTIHEERLKVLEMVKEGKITPQEASVLLDALEGGSGVNHVSTSAASPTKERKGKIFRIKVSDTMTGRTRVDVRLPVGLVNAGIKAGAKFAPEIEGVNFEELMTVIEAGEMGKLVDVYDEEDDEHVEVWIE